MGNRTKPKFNPKRQITTTVLNPSYKHELANGCQYGGNPDHKCNPGDFGLTPPANARPDKSWCDRAGVFARAEALDLLRKGMRQGFVSAHAPDEWPQNVWVVRESDGEPFEAQLENPVQGVYHGYPMQEADPFRQHVLNAWEKATS